jgi:hypothetical protein
MRSAKSFSLLTAILFTMITNAQNNDRLGVKGPINFDSGVYSLSWSSHPTDNYFKQEYLQKGEDVNKFKSMIMLEVASGAINLKDAVGAKVSELKSLKASNPFISYDTFYMADKGEYLLDFVITQNSADNKSALIAERNVYRYKKLSSGNGIMLFAVSIRSYDADTKNFLATLKNGRKALADKVRSYSLPVITLK